MFGLSNEVYLKIMNIVKKYKYDFYIINIQYTVDLIFVNKIEKQQLLDSIKKEGIKLNGKI